MYVHLEMRYECNIDSEEFVVTRVSNFKLFLHPNVCPRTLHLCLPLQRRARVGPKNLEIYSCVLESDPYFSCGAIYIFEYKFNIVEDVNIIFCKFNFWRHHELVGSGWIIICIIIIITENGLCSLPGVGQSEGMEG